MDIQIVNLFPVFLQKGRNHKLTVPEQRRSRKDREEVQREKGRDRSRLKEKVVKGPENQRLGS